MKRILLHHLPLFQDNPDNRRVPAELGGGTIADIMHWLLGLVTAHQTEARHAATELVYILSRRTGTKPRQIIMDRFHNLHSFLSQVSGVVKNNGSL